MNPSVAIRAVRAGTNPYVGPRAFSTGEQLFGRDREWTTLLDMLIAKQIVLLYSPSGAGKTSLIQAALIPALQREQFNVLPMMRVSLRPQRLEALALSDAPPGKAGRLCIRPTDIDVDAADLKRVRAVEWEDTAVTRLQLRVYSAAYAGDGQEQQKRNGETAGEHARRLLATTAWKSKRLVSTAPRG